MAVFSGFLGATYSQRSLNVAGMRTMNLYPEVQEVAGGKTQVALYSRLGLKSWLDLGGSEVRGLWEQNGRAFAVADGTFYEIFAGASSTSYGSVAWDSNPVTMCSNGQAGNQVFITSGQSGYIFDLSANTLTRISDASFLPTRRGGFVDGYFVSQISGTAKFQICNLEAGTNWSSGSAGTAQRSEGSDNLSAVVVANRLICVLGQQTGEDWYNSGATFPFQPLPSVFLETGCGATYSPALLAGDLVYLARSARGAGYAVRRTPGNAPSRISTMGVEWLWSQYSTITDAIGFSVEWQGHAWWYLYFPTAGATWVYDASQPPELAWHEESYWNAATATREAALPRCHAYAFGQHLVGMRNSGKIAILDPLTYDDLGNPINWYRDAAHICTEQVRQIHDRFQADVEVGVGLTSDAAQGYNPLMTLSWSDDGGHTFTNGRQLNMGKLGQYTYRAYTTALGQTRDRVYRLQGSDPVKTAIVGAYLNTRMGTS